ncbi:MAG: hypothetical protein ACYC4T_06990 [Melioribacteraceae bacterium]
MKISKIIFSSPLAHEVIRGLIIFTLLLLTSCSGSRSSIYNSDIPLTKEIAKSKSSQLSIRIPQGWFSAEDNENNLIDLWLIKDDYSATLNFVAMNLDSVTVKDIGGDEINNLVRLSELFRKAKYGKAIQKFSNQEIFEINKKQFAAYEYEDNSKRLIRVVVFSYGTKFYELSAIPVKTQNLQELYKIQNSVLSSID